MTPCLDHAILFSHQKRGWIEKGPGQYRLFESRRVDQWRRTDRRPVLNPNLNQSRKVRVVKLTNGHEFFDIPSDYCGVVLSSRT